MIEPFAPRCALLFPHLFHPLPARFRFAVVTRSAPKSANPSGVDALSRAGGHGVRPCTAESNFGLHLLAYLEPRPGPGTNSTSSRRRCSLRFGMSAAITGFLSLFVRASSGGF